MTTKTRPRTSVPAVDPAGSASSAVDAITAGPDLHAPRVDPRTLTIDVNVRSQVRLDAAFIDSIRDRGVEQPVMVRRTTLGELLVVDGQRRVLAALETDQATVPVHEVEGIGDEETRTVVQLIANDQRTDLLPGERAAAYQQLSLLGRSAESIAKKVHAPVDYVEKALAVAGSKAATEVAADRPDLTLPQLAAIAEFEDDAGALQDLFEVAENDPSAFPHVVQRLRDDREEARAIAARVAELQAAGVTVLEEHPSYTDKATDRLDNLTDTAGGKALPPAKHAETCPGHAVHVSALGYGDNRRVYEVPFCVGWQKHGHVNRWARASSGATSGPQDEDQRTARKQLIENNKAAASAEKVRRTWISELLKRKTLPTDAIVVAARLLGSVHDDAYAVTEIRAHLLDVDQHSGYLDTINTPAKATAYLLAWGCARLEAITPKDFWRDPSAKQAAYLQALAAWEYPLSDVEQLAVDNAPKAAR